MKLKRQIQNGNTVCSSKKEYDSKPHLKGKAALTCTQTQSKPEQVGLAGIPLIGRNGNSWLIHPRNMTSIGTVNRTVRPACPRCSRCRSRCTSALMRNRGKGTALLYCRDWLPYTRDSTISRFPFSSHHRILIYGIYYNILIPLQHSISYLPLLYPLYQSHHQRSKTSNPLLTDMWNTTCNTNM